jgi:hypothetical protein
VGSHPAAGNQRGVSGVGDAGVDGTDFLNPGSVGKEPGEIGLIGQILQILADHGIHGQNQKTLFHEYVLLSERKLPGKTGAPDPIANTSGKPAARLYYCEKNQKSQRKTGIHLLNQKEIVVLAKYMSRFMWKKPHCKMRNSEIK